MSKDPTITPELYNQEILNFGNTHGKGKRLENCDISTEDVGSLCGSRIIIDIQWQPSLEENLKKTIKDIGYHVDACALGTAAAAIFSTAAVGCNYDDIKEMHLQMKKMLKGESFCFKKAQPHGNSCYEDFSLLQAAKLYPSRHAAILLPITASLKAFDNH